MPQLDGNKLLVTATGAMTGVAIQMNWMANASRHMEFSLGNVIGRVVVGAIVISFVFRFLHRFTIRKMADLVGEKNIHRYVRWDAWSFVPALATLGGIFGMQTTAEIVFLIVMAILTVKFVGLKRCAPGFALTSGPGGIGILFLISGFAALIYQVAWQRILFATFGIDMESVTLVISAFMFGLGLGSLLGGALSEKFSSRLPELFFGCEICIGLFGLFSLTLIRAVSDMAVDGTFGEIALTIFSLICFPTMMMGATLPILVTFVNQKRENVGSSIGWLYYANTAGSALAALLTVKLLFPLIGLAGSVYVAAAFNFAVGVLLIKSARGDTSQLIPEAGSA